MQELLKKSIDCIGFAKDDLHLALKKSNSVESLVLKELADRAASLQRDTWLLLTAHNTDAKG